MTSSKDRWQAVCEVLGPALELAPEERAAYIEAACHGDDALRAEVETYLASGDGAGRHAASVADPLAGTLTAYLAPLVEDLAEDVRPGETDPGDFAISADGEATWEGREVGPYRVVRLLGHGGMGTVFLAERDDLGRRVALKVLQGGPARTALRRRFLLERRIQAGLEHPNIARLYDAGLARVRGDGSSAEEVPYFAMEYVEGQALDRYCDEHRLPVRERLRLFLDVLEAVQFAHQNLLVHRDLKPSNILVTEEGEVRLLDFGVAKLLSEAEEDEIADALAAGDVEAKTIIGGEETSTGGRLMTPAYAAPEQVRGGEITTATDVYTLGVLLYELLVGRRPWQSEGSVAAASASSKPVPPSAAVADAAADDEVEADVATARRTSPRRLRRQLRGDLDRVALKALAEEPRQRYGSAEALAEDLRRHLTSRPVAAREGRSLYPAQQFVRRHWKGLVVTALVATALMTAAALALRQAAVAEREATRAGEVEAFLVGLFEDADPFGEGSRDLSAEDLLDRGAERIREELVEQPEVRADLLTVIGTLYRSLGLYDKAEPHLEEALALNRTLHGEDHPSVADGLHELGVLNYYAGDFGRADSLYRAALNERQRLLGQEHEKVAESMNALGALQLDQGEYEEAERLLLAALPLQRRLLGEQHPDVSATLNNLGTAYEDQGRYKEAEARYREALAMRRRIYGEIHPEVALSLNNLAGALYEQGEYEEAEALYREALAVLRRLLGEGHPWVAFAANNLANVLRERGAYAEAERYYREALTSQQGSYGDDGHPAVAVTLTNLARVLYEQEQHAEAEARYQEAIAMQRELLGEEHIGVSYSSIGLGQVLLARGEADRAEALMRRGLEIRSRVLPEEDPGVTAAKRHLSAALVALGRFDEAEQLLLEACPDARQDAVQQRSEAATADDLACLDGLAKLYEAWGKPAKAAQYRLSSRDTETS